MERNDERRSKEGDAAGLNTSLPLGGGDSFVAGAYFGSPQACDGFGNLEKTSGKDFNVQAA